MSVLDSYQEVQHARRRRRVLLVLKVISVFPLCLALAWLRLTFSWRRIPFTVAAIIGILGWVWFAGSTIRDEW